MHLEFSFWTYKFHQISSVGFRNDKTSIHIFMVDCHSQARKEHTEPSCLEQVFQLHPQSEQVLYLEKDIGNKFLESMYKSSLRCKRKCLRTFVCKKYAGLNMCANMCVRLCLYKLAPLQYIVAVNNLYLSKCYRKSSSASSTFEKFLPTKHDQSDLVAVQGHQC